MASRGDTEHEKWSEHTLSSKLVTMSVYRIKSDHSPVAGTKPVPSCKFNSSISIWCECLALAVPPCATESFYGSVPHFNHRSPKCLYPMPRCIHRNHLLRRNLRTLLTKTTQTSSLGTLHPWSCPLHLGSHWKPFQHLVPIHLPFPPRPPPFHLHPFNDDQQGAVYFTIGRTTRTSRPGGR